VEVANQYDGWFLNFYYKNWGAIIEAEAAFD